MKNIINKTAFFCLSIITTLTSCEKDLEPEVFNKLAPETFFKNGADAKAALTNLYMGMMEGSAGLGYGTQQGSWMVQSSQTTDELICSWGDSGRWAKLNTLNFDDQFNSLTDHYTKLMPKITNATILLERINTVSMDAQLKLRYLAEVKALRAHLSYILYTFYGPVSIVVDPAYALNPNSVPEARPTSEWMIRQIEKDYKDAIIDLPTTYPASDYGRFTKGAAMMGLLKLYMKEKKWTEALAVGKQLQTLEAQGIYSLVPEYEDIFKIENEQNKEMILAISCQKQTSVYNMWLAHVMPGNYVDPSGQSIEAWGGYKMPWKTYDKFNPADKRLKQLLAKYPTDGGAILDARAAGMEGAIPKKYGIDPDASGEEHSTDLVVWRYADVLLSMSEVINEINGPTQEAYDLINRVRTRAGLPNLDPNLSKDLFRNKIMDERLFELWCEGSRRDDLIRWGTYIKRAIDDGSAFATENKILYPLPRKAVDESNGKITQNPGY
ncbi:RagB/SusD family nutrient uptake outer membrane protein [Flavobacterium sp. 245]|uniref:RagB/SusD family nutrient uptake outer membrane protein n=1 Tax=Flavobacterium sp. 245 TaxID=2512115 RepID=UPI001060CE56|nr:RagB/SusD family nutrient uptake outer membrane protein [Flavobacterium sp. 245]TDO94911.1 putative outer membrane starch-binding protein [Flavobacterium sp. 245]